MRKRKPSPGLVIACLALVVALGGTAIAASRYIITSSSQIKPSVLRELRGDASAARVASKGAKAVVARARSVGVVKSVTEPASTEDPLTGATWTQGADEVEQLVGQTTVTTPALANCRTSGRGFVRIEILLDGRVQQGGLGADASNVERTETVQIAAVPKPLTCMALRAG
jgi:hypothetical protein